MRSGFSGLGSVLSVLPAAALLRIFEDRKSVRYYFKKRNLAGRLVQQGARISIQASWRGNAFRLLRVGLVLFSGTSGSHKVRIGRNVCACAVAGIERLKNVA